MGRVVIADDDTIGITVEAKKVDSSDDPGFVLKISNKTDGKVYVYSNPGWTVKGAQVNDPVLRALVDPGETSEEFMWFDHGNLPTSSLDGLKEVVGTLVVEDYGTSAILGEYGFSL